jgi:hypothetical protein
MAQPTPNRPPDNPGRPRCRRSKRAQNGDCTRARRFADSARQRFYAAHRAQRFARRMIGDAPAN